jgi:hypothetical protein
VSWWLNRGVFLPLHGKEKLGIPNIPLAPWKRSSVLVVLLLKARQLIYTGYANSEKFHCKGISLNWIDMPIPTARTKFPIGTFPYSSLLYELEQQ